MENQNIRLKILPTITASVLLLLLALMSACTANISVQGLGGPNEPGGGADVTSPQATSYSASDFVTSTESIVIVFDESMDTSNITVSFGGQSIGSGLSVSWSATNLQNDTLTITGPFTAGAQTLTLNGQDIAGNTVSYTKNHTVFTSVNGTAFYYVKTPADGGNDANDGKSPATAKASVKSALLAASAGNAILVAEGVYEINSALSPQITLKEGVSLYGGYSKDFSVRDHNIYTSKIIDIATMDINHPFANGTYRRFMTIKIPGGITNATVVDGFSIWGSVSHGLSAQHYTKVGVYAILSMHTDGAPIFQNNFIHGGENRAGAAKSNTAVYVINNASATPGIFRNNIIYGGGVYGSYTTGVLLGGTKTAFYNNVIHGGAGTSSNIAINSSNGTNLATFSNNIIIGQTATKSHCFSESTENGSTFSDPERFTNNNLFGCDVLYANHNYPVNFITEYTNIADVNALSDAVISGNVSQDPLFVDAANWDYHLQASSPVETREGGLDLSAVFTKDYAGLLRTAVINGTPANTDAAGWSMGPYEFSAQ